MNFQEELNEEQYAAVTAPDGAALVVAAAGTGKTRTLIYRLAWLVTEKNVQPWEVLLLTFTNKAAKEMLTRAEDLVQRRFNSGYSGTFHSFANRLSALPCRPGRLRQGLHHPRCRRCQEADARLHR